MDNHSRIFQIFFTNTLFTTFFRIMSGGAESGFRHVKPSEYRPRLLHFHGDKKGIKVTEIRRNHGLLDNTDVYILDLGLKLYQWNGSGCNMQEKMKVHPTISLSSFSFN